MSGGVGALRRLTGARVSTRGHGRVTVIIYPYVASCCPDVWEPDLAFLSVWITQCV